ncbi:MAG: 16S rRNA (guanine(527)-N(7))-methyltransferase RsmG [Planctomycetota bacterium]|nr:16S rRNA (guanine(527)-N(7))-methyltransferase RsmG [Planctomycetota bacterium]
MAREHSRGERSRPGDGPGGARDPSHQGGERAPRPPGNPRNAGDAPPRRERPEPDPRAPLTFDLARPGLPVPTWLAEELAEIGVELDPQDGPALARFLSILLAANEVVNLTAITEPDEAWRRHILDALSLVPLLADLPEGARVADVGSGGGVPAIPLAITMPQLRFTCIDATGKKAQFLREAAAALGLANLDVLCERAEVAGQRWREDEPSAPRLRESFDAVTARALGRLNVAAELTVPLAAVGGRVLLVKGEKAEEELAEAAHAIGVLGARHALTMPTPTGRIVVLEKRSRTPKVYPRSAGEPKKNPL